MRNSRPFRYGRLDIDQCIHHLSAITGDITTDDILCNIFRHFCVGK